METLRVLSIKPNISEISVGSQMERSVSVWSDRNIWDHLWRWSTLTRSDRSDQNLLFHLLVVPSSVSPSLAWYIHDGDSADVSVHRLKLYNDWPNRIINAFLLCADDYPRYVCKACWQFLLFRVIDSLNIVYIHFPTFCFRNVCLYRIRSWCCGINLPCRRAK